MSFFRQHFPICQAARYHGIQDLSGHDRGQRSTNTPNIVSWLSLNTLQTSCQSLCQFQRSKVREIYCAFSVCSWFSQTSGMCVCLLLDCICGKSNSHSHQLCACVRLNRWAAWFYIIYIYSPCFHVLMSADVTEISLSVFLPQLKFPGISHWCKHKLSDSWLEHVKCYWDCQM